MKKTMNKRLLGLLLSLAMLLALAPAGLLAVKPHAAHADWHDETKTLILDDFESYANTAALTGGSISYATYYYEDYPLTGSNTTITLNETGADAAGGTGKSLKLANSSDIDTSVIVTGLDFTAGYDGITYWIKNASAVQIAPYVTFTGSGDRYIIANAPYFMKADNETEYTKKINTTQYYDLKIPAGWAGRIRVPFSSLSGAATNISPLRFQIRLSAASTGPVYFDDFGLYPLDWSDYDTPGCYETLDNFDDYADTSALRTKWLAWSSGGTASVELLTSGAKSGKAMKMSGDLIESFHVQADFLFIPNLAIIAKGLCFWVDNSANAFAVGSSFRLDPSSSVAVTGRNFFLKADGTDDFIQQAFGGGPNANFPLVIPAGFKGEIAIPFSSYNYNGTDNRITFRFWMPDTTTNFSIIFDDLRVYGIDTTSYSKPDSDYYMLDNFDGYENDGAMQAVWYLRDTYGDGTIRELVTDAQARGGTGKAMKLTLVDPNPNGRCIEPVGTFADISIMRTAATAKGFSLWINNSGAQTLQLGLIFNTGWVLPLQNKVFYLKADGQSVFAPRGISRTGNQPIDIPAGFKGEIAIPFACYNASTASDIMIRIIAGASNVAGYSVIVDDFQLYGANLGPVPNPDYAVLDNFDEYADTNALKAKWTTYAHAPGAPVVLESVTTGAKSGKAVRATGDLSAAFHLQASFASVPSLVSSADGFIFWVDNSSQYAAGFSLRFDPSSSVAVTGRSYYLKADGTSEFVPQILGHGPNSNFPFVIPAGFKGEIAIPFSSYNYNGTDTTLILRFWTPESTNNFSVILDDLRVYGADHDYEWVVTTPPTCSAPGEETEVCKHDSGHTRGVRSVGALGHDAGAWHTTQEATCTLDGTKELRCTRCQAVIGTDTIPAGHIWVKSGETPATCENDAIWHYECSECEDTKDEPQNHTALGHDAGAWHTMLASTCTAAGTKELRCTRCQHVLATDTISALGHNWEWVETSSASCTEAGVETKTCKHCGATDGTREGEPATGHEWSNWTVTKAPTKKAEGEETKTCPHCGATETRKTDALGGGEKEGCKDSAAVLLGLTAILGAALFIKKRR